MSTNEEDPHDTSYQHGDAVEKHPGHWLLDLDHAYRPEHRPRSQAGIPLNNSRAGSLKQSGKEKNREDHTRYEDTYASQKRKYANEGSAEDDMRADQKDTRSSPGAQSFSRNTRADRPDPRMVYPAATLSSSLSFNMPRVSAIEVASSPYAKNNGHKQDNPKAPEFVSGFLHHGSLTLSNHILPQWGHEPFPLQHERTAVRERNPRKNTAMETPYNRSIHPNVSGTLEAPLGEHFLEYENSTPRSLYTAVSSYVNTGFSSRVRSQDQSEATFPMFNYVTPGIYQHKHDSPKDKPARQTTTSTKFDPPRFRSNLPTYTNMPAMKSYQYQPLREADFRLVKVLPGRSSSLRCEILHKSLRDPSNYIAISYAWGDGLDTMELILDDRTVWIAASLHGALRAIRHVKIDILVWADALSINQHDRDERASQVRWMGHIYSHATFVAIWLGPEADNSPLAIQLLEVVAKGVVSARRIRSVHDYADSTALLTLFKRDYWRRLWVVQEVLLAKTVSVYCGCSIFPWEVYRQAAQAFWPIEDDPHVRQGPSSFPDMKELVKLGDSSLLEVLRACRKKLSENPRDKVFGILGLLPETIQHEFPVDYNQSIKTVYTDVVDYLISTTERLDVIRESIHFPFPPSTTGLPSWCPDWSHTPELSSIGRNHGFDASSGTTGPTKAQFQFHNRRRALQISAIRLDVIRKTGIAVGTLCASQDYLTAFLHWRSVLLERFDVKEGDKRHPVHRAFCRTLCLGQIPKEQSKPQLWLDLCYHVFSSLVLEKLPRLAIDEDLRCYSDDYGLIEPRERRKFLQDHFGNRMMGRRICITNEGLIGMGSAYLRADDIVVVPLGCSTPIVIRPEERRDEYRYVGDIYVDGYMQGEVIQQMESGDPNRVVSKYMLC